MKDWATTLAILLILPASLVLAEDFQTINGKVYKDATISRVEADGIMLRTKMGISKVYFVELPKNVQERFHFAAAKPVVAQREPEPIKIETKQEGSRRDAGGWAGALQVPVRLLRLLSVGALIITGVVILIVRRFGSKRRSERS